jgi:hypothetical protein
MTRDLHNSPDDDPPLIVHLIDRLALLIALAVVIARCTMLETIREPLEMTAGAAASPRGAGATSGLVLSLLAAVPALLVLLRRMIDPTFAIHRTFAIAGLMLAGGWAVASALWAADAFAALLGAFNWLSAMTLAWAVAQLVRGPSRRRLVAGVGVGLLLVFAAQGLMYRFSELPALKQHIAENRQAIVAERGWAEDSFSARQFFQKINNGEMVGFSASPNTFAALLVVTVVLAAGLAIQRTRDGDGRPIAWPMLLGAPIVAGVAVIYWTHSRAALATLMLAAVAFTIVGMGGRLLRRFAGPLFAIGVVGFLIVVALVVWRGSTTGTLGHDSLTFRWRYWLGAFGVFLEHPLVGVGFENFGPHYLGHRLPIASEEVRDPHNFIVRVFTELGLIGGLLLIVAVGRLIWEMTRSTAATDVATLPSRGAIEANAQERSLVSLLAAPVGIGLAGMLLNAAAAIDWGQSGDYIDLELRKRLMFVLLIAAGVAMATLARPRDDARPTPWVRAALVIAALLFLLQNLVDFSMFETGGMFLFALIAGSAVAVSRSPVAARERSFARRAWLAAAAALAWGVAFFTVAVPVGLSESDAVAADELRRTRRAGAADLYARAFDCVPYNADYAVQTARSLLDEQAPIEAFRSWIDRAIAANPMSVGSLLMSGRVESQLPSPNVNRLRYSYERALAIDPQNVNVAIEYGELLAKLGSPRDAARWIEVALVANAGLHPDEPKRLPPATVAQLERRIAELAAP